MRTGGERTWGSRMTGMRATGAYAGGGPRAAGYVYVDRLRRMGGEAGEGRHETGRDAREGGRAGTGDWRWELEESAGIRIQPSGIGKQEAGSNNGGVSAGAWP